MICAVSSQASGNRGCSVSRFVEFCGVECATACHQDQAARQARGSVAEARCAEWTWASAELLGGRIVDFCGGERCS